jgi:hypothetical protein
MSLKMEENYYVDSFYKNFNNKYGLLPTLDYKICPIYSWKAFIWVNTAYVNNNSMYL